MNLSCRLGGGEGDEEYEDDGDSHHLKMSCHTAKGEGCFDFCQLHLQINIFSRLKYLLNLTCERGEN